MWKFFICCFFSVSILLFGSISSDADVEKYLLEEMDLPSGWTIVDRAEEPVDNFILMFQQIHDELSKVYGIETTSRGEEFRDSLTFLETRALMIKMPKKTEAAIARFQLCDSLASAKRAIDTIQRYMNQTCREAGEEPAASETGQFGDGGIIIDLDPDDFIIFHIKNVVYAVITYKKEAATIAHIIDGKKRGLLTPEELFSEGVRLYSEGRYNEAINCFNEVLRDRPRNKDAHHYLANCYMSLQQFGAAAEEYEKAAQFSDNRIEKISYLGNAADIYKTNQMYPWEKRILKKMIEGLHPTESDYAFYYVWLIELYFMDGEYQNAMDLACRAYELFPYDSAVQDIVARVREKIIEIDNERQEKALSDEYLRQGIKAYNEGDYKKAEDFFEQAYNYDWNNAEAHYWYGKAAVQRRHFEFARQSFNRAIEVSTDSKKKNALLKELKEVDKAEKRHRAPKLNLEILKTDIELKPGQTYALEDVLRVDNKGLDTARDVMIDVSEAETSIAAVSVYGNIFIGDVGAGRSAKPKGRIYYILAKEAGTIDLPFRARCADGEPSEKKSVRVIVAQPQTQKIPAISERVSSEGQPVQEVIIREEAEKQRKEDIPKIKGLVYEEKSGGGRFEVFFKNGVCSSDAGSIGFVDTPIVIETIVSAGNKPVAFYFSSIRVEGNLGRDPNVVIDSDVWEFTKGWRRTKTIFVKSLVIPTRSLVIGSPKWDVKVPRGEEVRITTVVTPKAKGLIKISWDYPYTFDEYKYLDRDYTRYDRFDGEMLVDVLGEEGSIKSKTGL